MIPVSMDESIAQQSVIFIIMFDRVGVMNEFIFLLSIRHSKIGYNNGDNNDKVVNAHVRYCDIFRYLR